jgi:Laminin B (Domain IV)
MQSVLANLSNIEIRAEYSAARDIDGIDNVTLTSTSTPEPVTSALLICGGFFMLIHRRIWMRG